MTTTRTRITTAATLTAFVAAGCSSSSSDGGGTITGLTGPGSVSVVTPDETTGGGGSSTVAPGATVFPPGSDYATDEASVWVYDPSMEPLETINMILCMTSKAAYGEMVNRGAYLTQLDMALCDAGSDTSSDGGASGNSSGEGTNDIELYTVNSTRASNASPQIVHFWVPGDNPDNPGSTIYAEMRITARATEANPFGRFTMNFAEVPVAGTLANPAMFGLLRTVDAGAGIGFQFYISQGDITQPQLPGDNSAVIQVNVTMDQAQETGFAKIVQQVRYNDGGGDSGIQTSDWKVAFNDTHFKRQQGTDPVKTFSRSDFISTAWRYNLYHAIGNDPGARVELNSGFGFETAGGEYGWMGYYGLWVPEGVTVNDGDTIFEQTNGDGLGPAYTVVRAPGRLIRNTRNTMDLTDLAGQTFHWWDGGMGTNFLVDYSAPDFRKIAQFDEPSDSWQEIDPPVAINVAGLGGFLDMWSESLGGNVSYVDGDSTITFFERSFVNGASDLFDGAPGGEVLLYGYFNCIDAGITTAEAELGDVFLANAPNVGTPHVFRINESDLTLMYDDDGSGTNLQPVGLGVGQAPTTGPNTWGMQGGPYVTTTVGLTNTWDVWNVSEFYTYETGHNPWNQYTAVKDALNAYVEFDAPMQFLYTHSQANDVNDDATYDGQSFVLNYGGPGNLWGIPHEGVDLDGDMNEDRWYPLFGLADGVEVGPTGTEFAVRGMEYEQRLDEDPGGAPTLDVDDANALVLPTELLYETPNMDAEPAVDDSPAVVDGVVQTND